jgi:hypothetical protein
MMLFLCPSFQREIERMKISEKILRVASGRLPALQALGNGGNPYFLYIYI